MLIFTKFLIFLFFLNYIQLYVYFRGIFEWGLLYKETEITEEEIARRKFKSEPFRFLFCFLLNMMILLIL